MTGANLFIDASLIGVGGTVALDLWALLMARMLNMPAINWAMVGRWIGNMPRGQFIQQNMMTARPVRGEAAIGWSAHYAIGIGYGWLLLALRGPSWFAQPTLFPPLILSWALLVAPYFIMMPGMGSGTAGSKTSSPNLTRLKSVIGHSVFGLGMYATGLVLAGSGMADG
ncbi:DUF2938 domain-containing protein [uncultured Sphingomonas sp.]|uniref:DUF2938 domain-containing protein n=1 Tax=uncultured Sphingomonas sp. TaxID=158754 RepID=UPI00263471F3|nr:DUF2938 domain-containing protein [uncultured Sphingomonas sp.]